MACVLALTTSVAAADGPVYGEVQVAAGAVRHSELDFYPTFGSINAGVYVYPNIGIEVFADAGIGSDESDGLDLDIESAAGTGLRLQSPPSAGGVQGYVVLGAVNYTLDQVSSATPNRPRSSVDEDFLGLRVSVGFMQRLKSFRNLQFTAEYRHYNADEPLRVDALVFGLRVNAP
jgi:hypothetical protein